MMYSPFGYSGRIARLVTIMSKLEFHLPCPRNDALSSASDGEDELNWRELNVIRGSNHTAMFMVLSCRVDISSLLLAQEIYLSTICVSVSKCIFSPIFNGDTNRRRFPLDARLIYAQLIPFLWIFADARSVPSLPSRGASEPPLSPRYLRAIHRRRGGGGEGDE
jgi:hypothetical protein